MSKGENMVERCAMAIYEDRNGPGAIPWSRRGGSHREPYMRDARAVIEALVEPTKSMVLVGMDAMSIDDLEPTEDEFRAGFVAALRTILSQPNDEGEGK